MMRLAFEILLAFSAFWGWGAFVFEFRRNKKLWATIESYRKHALEGLRLLDESNAVAGRWRRLAVFGGVCVWLLAAVQVWKNRNRGQK